MLRCDVFDLEDVEVWVMFYGGLDYGIIHRALFCLHVTVDEERYSIY